MEEHLFLLEKFHFDRAKSDVKVDWLTREVDGETIGYPGHSLRGSYIPADDIVEALDAYRSTVAQLLGTDRDFKAAFEVADTNKLATVIKANHETHLRDITIKAVKVKRDGDEMQTVTITAYVRGPLGKGTAMNFSVKVNEEGLGIEDEIAAKTEALAALVTGFVKNHGHQQLNLYSEPANDSD